MPLLPPQCQDEIFLAYMLTIIFQVQVLRACENIVGSLPTSEVISGEELLANLSDSGIYT